MSEKFTLIIPTYNEAPIIADTLKTLVAAFSKNLSDTEWSIIVTDNASTDTTTTIVERMKDPHVRVIRLPEKGRGRAIRAGFMAAGGGTVAFTDADLSVSPEEVITGLGMIRSGQTEVVIGTRFTFGNNKTERKWLRQASSRIYLLLARLIVGLSASDSQCPLKMMRERVTKVMLATTDPTWFSELEFVALLERLQIHYEELPVRWNEKRYPNRKTKLKILADGLRAILAMFKIRFQLHKQVAQLKEALQ